MHTPLQTEIISVAARACNIVGMKPPVETSAPMMELNGVDRDGDHWALEFSNFKLVHDEEAKQFEVLGAVFDQGYLEWDSGHLDPSPDWKDLLYHIIMEECDVHVSFAIFGASEEQKKLLEELTYTNLVENNV